MSVEKPLDSKRYTRKIRQKMPEGTYMNTMPGHDEDLGAYDLKPHA